MSTRLDEARAACDEARRAGERAPDLFDSDSWSDPQSAIADWKAAALELVREAARSRRSFTVEDLEWPTTYDARARGAALLAAARRGWIVADGWQRGNAARHGRPVRRWKSSLYATNGRPRQAPAVLDPEVSAPNANAV